MTKLLEQAIAKARKLSESEQDAIAEALFAHLSRNARPVALTPEQAADVERICDNLRDARTRLATDVEVATLWTKCGL